MTRATPWRLIPPTGDRPLLRAVLLVGVFACVSLAFWWHFERRMVELNQTRIQDPARILTPAETKALVQMRTALHEEFGLDVLVRVDAQELAVPDLPPAALFVGANPARREAVIVLPPLIRRVLGEGPRLLAEEDLRQCMAAQSAGRCLQGTLQALRAGLEEK